MRSRICGFREGLGEEVEPELGLVEEWVEFGSWEGKEGSPA